MFVALISLLFSAASRVLAQDDIDSSPFIIDPNIKIVPDQYSGAFSYAFPLTIPPGRNNLQPVLDLSYSSANTDQNSIVGYGWSLNIPKIERLNKYGSDDLYSRHDFTSSLSGELEDISLSDATHGSFAAKVDDGSYLIYTYASNETWVAVDKSGTTYTFGAVSSSRVEDPNDSTHVYAWYLNEIRDTSDNFITYTYEKVGSQVYPLNINYTGNGTTSGIFDIDFSRESSSDDSVGYATGFALSTSDRISTIDVSVDANIVRSFSLDYILGDNGTRSLLSAITESGTDINSVTISKPATTFDYTVSERSYTEDTGFEFPLAIGNTGSSSMAVYMFDVNGDALPDVVKANSSVKEVYINDGGNSWTYDANYVVPFAFVDNVGRDWGVRVFDVDGDGLQDLVWAHLNSSTNLEQSVYINDGDGTGWTQDTSISVPIGFVNATGVDLGVRVFDVDGDGMQDIVKAQQTSGVSYREVYINDGDGTGWTQDTGYTLPIDFTIDAHDTGLRAFDVNGDNLVDLVKSKMGSTSVDEIVYLNDGDGTGWTEDANFTVPVAFITNAYLDRGVRFIDVNGDNLVDLMRAQTNSSGVIEDALYINNGQGWTEDTGFIAPRSFVGAAGYDYGVREVDTDGDMLDDIVYSRDNGAGSWTDQIYIPDGERGDLLSAINFSTGATSAISYTTSAAANTDLFFPLQVVDTVELNDGLGGSSVTEYTYENGDYYYADEYDRRFAGFGKVTTTDGLGNVIVDYYHQGNSTNSTQGESADHVSKIGKKYRQELYDSSNNLFKTTIIDWSNVDLGNDRNFVFTNQSLDLLYDGDTDHVDTATDYTYNSVTGNLTEQEDLGFVTGNNDGTYTDTGTDEIITTYTYATDTNGIIRNAVSSVAVEGHTGGVAKLTGYYYDGLAFGSVSTGLMTKQADWITGATYANTLYVYNAYGLPTSIQDAESSYTTYTYDATNPLQPLTVTNDLSQVTNYAYDLASGQVTQTTSPNGGISTADYDGFGRPLLIEQSQAASAATLDIVAEYVYDDASVPTSVHETRYLDGSISVNNYTYMDGLGRVIQTRKESEVANHYTVNDTSYNDLGQLDVISLSYDSTGSALTAMTSTADLLESYTYDAIGRVTSVVNATGSTSSVYDQSVVAETDANGETKRYAYSARGLLSVVEENINGNAYNTLYLYSALGNLTKYTDALGFVRNFTYDHLGNRLTAEDLHATSDTQFGSWSYTYNKVGSLLTTTDANGKVVTNTYDDLHRLLTENDPATGATDVTYTYDSACANGLGRLCSVTDLNAVTTAYTYDELGRTATTAKTIDGTTSTTTNSYDRQNNLTLITHPDTTKQEFTFGTAGRVASVVWRNAAGTATTLVSAVTYAPHGAVDTVTYGNGVSTAYDYDETDLYRLYNKTTTKGGTQFQDFTYTYDPSGNITAIVDAPTIYAQVSHVMTYDDLHRLTQAAATSTDANLSGTRNYTYNILGNILTSPIGTYLYQDTNAGIYSNPHAVTKIGTTVIAYDKNGNMTNDGTFTNSWDFKNRLITSAKTGNTITYLYDHTGNRVKKTDTTSGVPTYYVDSTYEKEGTKTRHHVSAPGIGNIATVITTSTTTTYAYHHTDHLGGTHVETDSSGNLLQYMVYEPYGKIRYNYKAGSYGNDYTYTGKELDSETSLQYFGARYYAPIAGKFTSADPIFLALGTSSNLNGLEDPQAWNSYAYGRNNPYRMVDPDGRAFWDVVRTLGHASNTALNFVTFGAGDAAREMSQTGLTASGVAQVVGGVTAGTAAVGGVAIASGYAAGYTAIQAGVATLAPVAVQTEQSAERSLSSASSLIGRTFGPLGRVVENSSATIEGFTEHGLDQTITRGVSPQAILNTVRSPLATLEQSSGTVLRLSRDAGVVLNQASQVVTTYSKEFFKPTVQGIVDSIK